LRHGVWPLVALFLGGQSQATDRDRGGKEGPKTLASAAIGPCAGVKGAAPLIQYRQVDFPRDCETEISEISEKDEKARQVHGGETLWSRLVHAIYRTNVRQDALCWALNLR